MPNQSATTILHIPHASTLIPESIRDQYLLTHASLDNELLRMTDHFTDELFDITQTDTNLTRLIYPVSRLVVDPERFRNDSDELMSNRGMGAVYMRTADGEPLRRELTGEEREELLVTFYDPHHAALTEMVQESLDQHGKCLIIDCHSFPSVALRCDLNQEPNRPDICIGTDPFHTPMALMDYAENEFLKQGWSVGINWPYAGAIVPMSVYGLDKRVMAIMVEVNRGLYMEESTGEKLAIFDRLQKKLQRCLMALTRWST